MSELSGANRDRTGDLLLAKQHCLTPRVPPCLQNPCKDGDLYYSGVTPRGHQESTRRTRWCTLGVQRPGGGEAERQLLIAASSRTAARAAAIAA